MLKIQTTLIILATFLLLSGCSRMQQFGGRVTFADETPLTAGMVVFQTSTFQAEGKLDTQGNYTLGSYKKDDGIPPGTYNVYILHAKDGNGKLLIHSKYENDEGGLSFTVDGKQNRFDIVVDPPEN